MTLNNISYPLGLLPSHVIRLCNLERKVSRQGSVYCQYVVISTLQVLEVQTQPPLTIRYGYYMWCWYITPADDNSWLTMLIPYSCLWQVVVTNVDTLHYLCWWQCWFIIPFDDTSGLPMLIVPLLMMIWGYKCWYFTPVDDRWLQMLIHYTCWWYVLIENVNTSPLLMMIWGKICWYFTPIADRLGLHVQLIKHYHYWW